MEQLERMDATRIVTSKVKKTRRVEDQTKGAFERTLSLTESLSEFCPAPPLTLEEHPATQVRQSSTLSAAGQDGAAPLIKSRSLRKNVARPGEGSIISMLKPMTFAIEGEHPEFFVFRLDELEQRVRVAWSTSVGRGRAVPHKHYVPSNGVITFEKGQNLASFTVEIVDDDGWEPIRDFVVQLDEVVEGRGSIGNLDRTNCGIVDDDVYPSKVDRDEEHPIPAKEQHFQSCMNSDIYLTADEVKDPILMIDQYPHIHTDRNVRTRARARAHTHTHTHTHIANLLNLVVEGREERGPQMSASNLRMSPAQVRHTNVFFSASYIKATCAWVFPRTAWTEVESKRTRGNLAWSCRVESGGHVLLIEMMRMLPRCIADTTLERQRSCTALHVEVLRTFTSRTAARRSRTSKVVLPGT